jgi:hypothetical protein
MLRSPVLTGIATVAVLTAGCEQSVPAAAPAKPPAARTPPVAESKPNPKPVASPPTSSMAAAAPTRPLPLHSVATTQVPARVYVSGATTRILVPSCIAEVHDTTITPGSYPLPGRSCREPPQQLASFGGRQWLQAGPELWVRTGSGAWNLESTLPRADHVLLPTGSSADGLALVVPFRQSGRSDYQASSSFELRRLGRTVRPKIPLPAAAKASPNLPFDDFISECSTKTRLATPKAFHVTADGALQVLGTECDHNDQSLRSVVETWKAGSATSSVEALPFTRPDRLLQVQVDNDRSIWALQSSQLLHFDGAGWTDVPLPPAAPTVSLFSASATGTLWVLTTTGELWEHKPGQTWEARTTSLALPAVSAMSAEGDDEIWLSTDTALFSTRSLATGSLCRTPCADFWRESARSSKVPHGD